MFSIPNSNSFSDMPLLSLGDIGEDVEYLQSLLNYFDYQLVVDGIFGLETEQAVKHFQRSYSLVVDGVVATNTWTVLHQYFHDFVPNYRTMALV